MKTNERIDANEFFATLDSMSIQHSAASRVISRLEHVLDSIDGYQSAGTDLVMSLREEGLTADEETRLCRALTRCRNSVILKYLDVF